MAHQSQLENRKYRNWVKAGLGLKYTKDGLEPFCDQLVKQQHKDIFDKVKQKHNLAAVNCGDCDIKTLQPDHVRTRSRQCPLGQISCNCQHPGGKIICPNNVCGAIYDEIIQLHAATPPSPYWKNTDTKHWCTEPWAVAKCFINATGYEEKLKASEFDCPGLIHVLINNIDFHSHLQCTITGANPFSKIIQIRNNIFHSPDMELEDNDAESYIDDMVTLLQDGKELQHTEGSKDAVKKLLKLKQEDFIITDTNEAEVRKAALSAIDEKEKKLEQTIKVITDKFEESRRLTEEKGINILNKIAASETEYENKLELKRKEIKDEIKLKKEDSKLELEEKCSEMKSALEQIHLNIKEDVVSKGKHVKQELEETETDIKKELTQKESNSKMELEKKVVELEDELEERKNDSRKNIDSCGLEIIRNIEKKWIEAPEELTHKDRSARRRGRTITDKFKRVFLCWRNPKVETREEDELNSGGLKQTVQRQQQKLKAEFKKKLVGGYKECTVKVSVLPLQAERNKADIDSVYVPPRMTVEIRNNETPGECEETDILMHQIFICEKKSAKNIYVIGEAGAGKSTFCKMLVYYWCLAHSERNSETIESDIVKVMTNYGFLFYVSLRHYSNLNKIEDILDEIYPDPILSTILQNESDKCLILLDGLDEWTPQNQRTSQFFTLGLPARDLHAKYTIITTTRRWKFETLRIKDSEIDKKIKLKGISGTAVAELTKTTVNTLNEIFHKNKAAADFPPALQNCPVTDVSHVPMILQQLICLWFDDKLRGTSKCAIYSSMLDLFFDWNALKLLGKQEVWLSIEHETGSRLPEYLKEYRSCFDNTHVIYNLSRLAFKTLFERDKENTLTFSNFTFQQLKIPGDVKTCSLQSGILTEDQNINSFASRRQHT